MDSGIAGLLGALIGGVTSWLATWNIEIRRDRRQARSLTLAAASEIEATLTIVKQRNWLDEFAMARTLAAEEGIVTHDTVHVRDDYLPMCRAAMTHAGIISRELSVKLTTFITLADALTSDLKRMADNPPGTYGALFDENDAKGAERVYAHLVTLLQSGFRVGTETIELIDKMYPKKDMRSILQRIKGAWNILITGSP